MREDQLSIKLTQWLGTQLNSDSVNDIDVLSSGLLPYISYYDKSYNFSNKEKEQLHSKLYQLSLQKKEELKIKTKLKHYSIPVETIKGQFYSNLQVLPNDFCRFQTDIDLLVSHKNKECIEHQLRHLGYHCLQNEKNNKEVWGKMLSGVEIVVELHFGIFINGKQLCSGEKPMSHEETFLFLLYHLMVQHNLLKLSWLIEVYAYTFKFNQKFDYENFFLLVKKFQMQNAYRLFNSICFKQFQFSLKPYPSRSLLFKIYEKLFSSTNFIIYPRKNRILFLFFKIIMQPSLNYTFSYFFRHRRKVFLFFTNRYRL